MRSLKTVQDELERAIREENRLKNSNKLQKENMKDRLTEFMIAGGIVSVVMLIGCFPMCSVSVAIALSLAIGTPLVFGAGYAGARIRQSKKTKKMDKEMQEIANKVSTLKQELESIISANNIQTNQNEKQVESFSYEPQNENMEDLTTIFSYAENAMKEKMEDIEK